MGASLLLRFAGVSLVAVALASGVSGCSGDRQEGTPAPPAAAPARPIDPATAGTVTGRITFDGPAGVLPRVRMSSDPNCPQEGGTADSLQVREGALANVFVYVKDGLGNVRFAAPASPVVLDQKGCRYTPHVLGIQVGQPLQIVNSDQTLHNVHAIPHANREFNTGQPVQGMVHTHTFSTSEVMVPFKCDVHRWMSAYVGVLDHPFFAVTSADGRFEIAGLPSGTYTIEAWHETLGTRTQTVTVRAREATEATWSFSGGGRG